MTAIVALFVFAFASITPGAAHAASLFDFEWSSSALFSTLLPVNRVEPDGSVTPYDEIRQSGTRAGSGVLTLTLPGASVGDYLFEFSGSGGAGTGQALAGGEILPGGFTFALPSDVPVSGPGAAALSGGHLTLEGDPARPSAVSISYFEGTSPHCLFNCSSVEFRGLGRARGNAVAAAEPEAAMLAALGLLGVAWRRARAARARAGSTASMSWVPRSLDPV